MESTAAIELSPSRRRTLVRPLIRDGAIIAVLLLAAELVLRVVAPHYALNLYDREFTGSMPVEVNSGGYRGALVPEVPPKGTLRILALGDSVTFGVGVRASEAWPAQLAGLITRNHGVPVDVVNAAVPAADIEQLAYSYRERWSGHDPDIVAMVASGNMVSLAWIRRDKPASMPANDYVNAPKNASRLQLAKTQANRFVKQFCLPSFLSQNSQRALYWLGLTDHEVNPNAPYGALLAYGWRQGGLASTVVDGAWSEAANDLKILRNAVASDDRMLLVGFSPPRFTLSNSWADNDKYVPRDRLTLSAPDRFEEVCEDLEVPCADLPSALRAQREKVKASLPLYIPFDYTHLDPSGHAAVAHAFLARAVQEPSFQERIRRLGGHLPEAVTDRR